MLCTCKVKGSILRIGDSNSPWLKLRNNPTEVLHCFIGLFWSSWGPVGTVQNDRCAVDEAASDEDRGLTDTAREGDILGQKPSHCGG